MDIDKDFGLYLSGNILMIIKKIACGVFFQILFRFWFYFCSVNDEKIVTIKNRRI